jgi:hypothetical protein
VLGATVAGMVGLLSFHTHATVGSLPAAGTGTTSRRSARGAAPSAPATSGIGGSSGSHASGPTGPASPGTTVTGATVQFGYGQLAVSVTLSGSTITAVGAPRLQTVDPYSQQIANAVIPMLRREVLKAQSARIAGVTGATYTSDAYAQSLQSALDKARHP